MGWAQKFLGKGSKEMWVYSENDKHRHEAALITKVEKWLDKEHAASAPWKVVATTYTTQYEKIAKIPASQNKTEDVMYLAKKHGP